MKIDGKEGITILIFFMSIASKPHPINTMANPMAMIEEIA
jgi:hypothetical protein